MELEFYGDYVYNLKKLFVLIIFLPYSHYKRLLLNINVDYFTFLINCTPVGLTSDSLMVPNLIHLEIKGLDPGAMSLVRPNGV